MVPDYYSLILRAVEQLETNASAPREALYRRARQAIDRHLRSRQPPASTAEIDAHMAALAAAIDRIEREMGTESHQRAHLDQALVKADAVQIQGIVSGRHSETDARRPGNIKPGSQSASRWILAGLSSVVLLGAGLFFLPRIVAVYYLFWGRDIVKSLLYDELGLSDAVASIVSTTFSFIYALAWVPLLVWTMHALTWKFSARQVVIAFASWIVIYGHAPLARALLGTNVCFNQRSGQPQKWYVVRRGGEVLFFDTGGYDSGLGEEKHPVTEEICYIHARQMKGIQPKRIENATELSGLAGPDGSPKLWYYKTSSGQLEFFDAPGFHPETRELLLPLSRELLKKVQDENAASQADATKWEGRTRQRLDGFLKTCNAVPATVTRIIVVGSQLLPDSATGFDLRSNVSGTSGLAIIPYEKLVEGLDRHQLKFHDTRWPGAEDRGPQFLLVQFRNQATDDGWQAIEQSDASLGIISLPQKIVPKTTLLRVMLLADLAVVDILKSNSEGIDIRALGKRTAASDWNTVGKGANGQCRIFVVALLDVT